MVAIERPGALGALALEEREAWDGYLEATRETTDFNYDEVEPWAWSRLNARLLNIQNRRVQLGGQS